MRYSIIPKSMIVESIDGFSNMGWPQLEILCLCWFWEISPLLNFLSFFCSVGRPTQTRYLHRCPPSKGPPSKEMRLPLSYPSSTSLLPLHFSFTVV